MRSCKYVLGVDEVGRGSLAGPVTVGSVLLPNRFYFPKKLPKLKDSKQLTQLQREVWFQFVLENKDILYETSSVASFIIDRIGISRAVNLAGTRSVKKIINKNNLDKSSFNLYTDGLLHINLDIEYLSIIRGDEKINAIKIASIMAKVTRDKKLVNYERKIGLYGFNKHKGYGTVLHKRMIKKYGPSKIHRLTFLNH